MRPSSILLEAKRIFSGDDLYFPVILASLCNVFTRHQSQNFWSSIFRSTSFLFLLV
jgi:hypothetical protein